MTQTVTVAFTFAKGPLAGMTLREGVPDKGNSQTGPGVKFFRYNQPQEVRSEWDARLTTRGGQMHNVFAQYSKYPELKAIVAEEMRLAEERLAAREAALRDGTQKIRLSYQHGSPLSGWVCDDEIARKILTEFSLIERVEGWGYMVNHAAAQSLGSEFTYQQAEAYALPILAAAHAKKSAFRAAYQARIDAALAQARATGKNVVVRSWSEMVDEDENSLTIINEVATPDGRIVREECPTH